MFNHKVNLVWATPNAENVIAYCARVSNKKNQNNTETSGRLLSYLIRNKHWSPFEMASMCLEIETTRDISRQLLRHRSFSFQEFSQRYSDEIECVNYLRETRLQDVKNRQNSIEIDNVSGSDLHNLFLLTQKATINSAKSYYQDLIHMGIAKEQARCILPEGLTMSRLYVSGTIRSWIHYCEVRMDETTQKEHRLLAAECHKHLLEVMPSLKEVL